MLFPKLMAQSEGEGLPRDRVPAVWLRIEKDAQTGEGEPSIPIRNSQRDFFKTEMIRFFTEAFCRERPVGLRGLIMTLEKNIILHVLSVAGGNQKEAAQILGINYTTLNQKLKRHGIRMEKKPGVFSS